MRRSARTASRKQQQQQQQQQNTAGAKSGKASLPSSLSNSMTNLTTIKSRKRGAANTQGGGGESDPVLLCFNCDEGPCVDSDHNSVQGRYLMECSFCPLAYHLDCLNPPLTVPVKGEWMCPNHHQRLLPDFKRRTRFSIRSLLTQSQCNVPDHLIKLNFLEKMRNGAGDENVGTSCTTPAERGKVASVLNDEQRDWLMSMSEFGKEISLIVQGPECEWKRKRMRLAGSGDGAEDAVDAIVQAADRLVGNCQDFETDEKGSWGNALRKWGSGNSTGGMAENASRNCAKPCGFISFKSIPCKRDVAFGIPVYREKSLLIGSTATTTEGGGFKSSSLAYDTSSTSYIDVGSFCSCTDENKRKKHLLSISRKHCAIVYDDMSHYFVLINYSEHGTSVNGEMVGFAGERNARKLVDNASISLQEFTVTFSYL